MKYAKLTEESIREMIGDAMFGEVPKGRKVKLWVQAWEDEDGNFHCPFMEELDREMKKYGKDFPTCGQQYEKQNNENEDLSQL